MIGLILLPANAYWVASMEMIRFSAPTTISLFFNCVFELVVLSLINSVVVRVKPRWALSQGELLLIYAMLAVGTALCGHDMIQILIPMLAGPAYLSDSSNRWQSLFAGVYPKWLTLQDPASATDFFHGNSTLYTARHMHAWAVPVIAWTLFLVVLLFVLQCINTILRKQWTDNERLAFPLVRLPLEITSNFVGGSGGLALYRNKIFWIGFAIAALIDIVNSINYYHPNVPPILVPGQGITYFTFDGTTFPKPWNAIGRIPVSYYPFMIGLGMLMPIDFLFSLWFFYLFWKLQAVTVVAAAWDADPRMPYANYQAFGAYVFFCVSSIYLARHYLKDVFRKALGLPSPADDSGEPLGYRSAVLGMLGGASVLIGFSIYLGMQWWIAILFFVIYFGLAVAITRMRAEMGAPIHDLHNTGPDWLISDVAGTRSLTPQDLGVFSLFFFLNRAYRSHPMPVQLEAFKMADVSGRRGELRRWFWVLLLAGAVGALSAMWAMLHLTYQFGAAGKSNLVGMRAYSTESWNRLATWISQPRAANSSLIVAIAAGFLFAAFLGFMRVRLAAFPFHPLAYAVSSSYQIQFIWMPFLIAWLIKTVLLRYGGVKTYQAALPFFYGLMLGQFCEGSLINIWGISTGAPTYQFW